MTQDIAKHTSTEREAYRWIAHQIGWLKHIAPQWKLMPPSVGLGFYQCVKGGTKILRVAEGCGYGELEAMCFSHVLIRKFANFDPAIAEARRFITKTEKPND